MTTLPQNQGHIYILKFHIITIIVNTNVSGL
jgi:hypothetical protein